MLAAWGGFGQSRRLANLTSSGPSDARLTRVYLYPRINYIFVVVFVVQIFIVSKGTFGGRTPARSYQTLVSFLSSSFLAGYCFSFCFVSRETFGTWEGNGGGKETRSVEFYVRFVSCCYFVIDRGGLGISFRERRGGVRAGKWNGAEKSTLQVSHSRIRIANELRACGEEAREGSQ